MIDFFCKRALQKRLFSAKETQNLKMQYPKAPEPVVLIILDELALADAVAPHAKSSILGDTPFDWFFFWGIKTCIHLVTHSHPVRVLGDTPFDCLFVGIEICVDVLMTSHVFMTSHPYAKLSILGDTPLDCIF